MKHMLLQARAPLCERARFLNDAAKCTCAFLQNALRQRSRWDRHELNTSTPWSCRNGRNGSECGGSAETARRGRSVGTHCAENSRAILQDPNAARHDAFGDQLGREEICVRRIRAQALPAEFGPVVTGSGLTQAV